MKNIIKSFRKICHIIIDECDVTKTLAVINGHHNISRTVRVGNCGWVDTSKWFIIFTTTDSRWKDIKKELTDIGVVYTTE